jgi:hypothetical protein
VVVFLVLLALIVVGVYFGVPKIYRDLVLPVRENTARLDALEQSLAADRASLLERLDNLQLRLNQLEVARAASSGEEAGLQSDVQALRSDLDGFALSLSRLDTIEGEIASLTEWLSFTSTRVMGMENSFTDPSGDLGGLRRDVAQLKALNLLTRAQVHLAQNNFGIAREDTAMARAVLVDLRLTAPEAEWAQIEAWIARLDLALVNLPNFPVLAAGDLEQAYQLMAAAMQPASVQLLTVGTETPTPATWLTETSAALTGTPTPLATFTPTPVRSFTPTPTATSRP